MGTTGGAQVKKDHFREGIALLKQPVLPLISMVNFLYLTGDFATVAEVIAEMPEPIETAYALYEHPRELLGRYRHCFVLLEELKGDKKRPPKVVDVAGNELDPMSAVSALVSQQVLEQELEAINAALCGPCGCSLCCVGPDETMEQHFFEIPLQEEEKELFPLLRHDDPASRSRLAMDEKPLFLADKPFYAGDEPALFHWQNGWSMILPRQTTCPGLADDGRCQVYEIRPGVCRKPQIFSYVLEPADADDSYRFRGSLLAITDCPYVRQLQDKIAAYAAACELEIVLKGNKQ